VITLHSIAVRVYYEDTDAGGIVYYANYLKFFERARTDWLREVGVSHRDMSEVEGLNLVVRDCAVQYLRPARLDDLLSIEVGLADPATDIGRASLRFTQRALLTARESDAGDGIGTAAVASPGSARRAGAPEILATGSVRVACMDRRTGRPVALPQRVMSRISALVGSQSSGQFPG